MQMKFLIFYIILLGYVFAEDKTCLSIKSNMAVFKYNYVFTLVTNKQQIFDCEVHPNYIDSKLYLLFICSPVFRANNSKDYIFAHKCEDEITKISDITKFSISTFNKLSKGIY